MRIPQNIWSSLLRAELVHGKALTSPLRSVTGTSRTARNNSRIPRLRRTAATSFLISLALLLPAEAATFVVTTLEDPFPAVFGDGSFRQAITDANNSNDPEDTILFDPTLFGVPRTLLLQTQLPTLLGHTVINGPGANRLTISPEGINAALTTIFFVAPDAVVSITGVTVEKGLNGAIINGGTLTLERCLLRGNQKQQLGGAISNFGNLVVRQSTLSGNVVKGVQGQPALGGAIYNNGNLWIVSSTISGNTVEGVDGVSGDFLTKKNAGTATGADSDSYYRVVDPEDAQHPEGRRATLGAWWQVNGFATDGSAPGEAKAAYLNNGDLGFGRDMHILQRANGDVAAYVSNYTLNLDGSPDQNPLSADAALARNPLRAVATVCMEYSPIENDPAPIPVVKFFVYNGKSGGAVRVGGADLDGNGPKFTPQLCTVCHGGSSPPAGHAWVLGDVREMKSYFREFDLASFKFPRPGTRIDDPSRSSPNVNTTVNEEAAFRSLNEKVLATNPSPAIRELVEGWYGGFGLPQPNQNTAFVPPGWDVGPDQAQLYRGVVGTSCRTCHVAQEQIRDFSTYENFRGSRSLIISEVLSDSTKVMPHAKVAFDNFWRAGRQTTLANFSGPGWDVIGTGTITGSPPGPARGGAIFDATVSQHSFDIVASTIVLNTAASGVGIINVGARGGGIVTGNSSSSLGNTLIANNFIHDVVFGSRDISGSATSFGFNLIGNTLGAAIGTLPSDLLNIADPKISPLTIRFGNRNPIHTLLLGSPALDQGGAATDPLSGNDIANDQHGVRRPIDDPSIDPNPSGGNDSDIGAFERTFSSPANVSTRAPIGLDNLVLIAGFIIEGNATATPKSVFMTAKGPSLKDSGVPGVLANPRLELHGPGGFATITNDNWRDTQQAEIVATGIPPTNDLESAIVAQLAPGAYTAIVEGVNGGTGVGLVEVYDLSRTDGSFFANISTRCSVQTGDNVLIGGLIVLGQDPLTVIVRALGPSLPVPDALGDPTLDLHDGNGALIGSNDNWRSDQEADIIATEIPPTSDLESTIVQILAPGSYTAIVRGVNNTTGVALVEAYGVN